MTVVFQSNIYRPAQEAARRPGNHSPAVNADKPTELQGTRPAKDSNESPEDSISELRQVVVVQTKRFTLGGKKSHQRTASKSAKLRLRPQVQRHGHGHGRHKSGSSGHSRGHSRSDTLGDLQTQLREAKLLSDVSLRSLIDITLLLIVMHLVDRTKQIVIRA